MSTKQVREEASRIVNTAFLAELLGLSERHVQLLAKEKIIRTKQRAPYRFVLRDAVQDYIAYKQKGDTADSIDDEARIKKAEAEIKENRATREKLMAQTLQGKMHEARDVKEFTSQIFTAFRQHALSLPNLCAIPTARTNDPAITASIIKEEVNNMLKELTKYDYEKAAYIRAARERAQLDMDEDVELLDEEDKTVQED